MIIRPSNWLRLQAEYAGGCRGVKDSSDEPLTLEDEIRVAEKLTEEDRVSFFGKEKADFLTGIINRRRE